MKTEIAIIEPHKQIRESLITVLEGWGYRVILSVETGRELLHQVMQAKEIPSIYIIDVNVYNMDGLRTAQQLRTYVPGANIIIYANDLHRKIFDCLQNVQSKDYYVDKNTNPALLKRALDLCSRNFLHIKDNKCYRGT